MKEPRYIYRPRCIFNRNDKDIIIIIEAQARLKNNKTDYDIVSYNRKTHEYIFGEYREYNFTNDEYCDTWEKQSFYAGDKAKEFVKQRYAHGSTVSGFQFDIKNDNCLWICKDPSLGWEKIFDPNEINTYSIELGKPMIVDTIPDYEIHHLSEDDYVFDNPELIPDYKGPW